MRTSLALAALPAALVLLLAPPAAAQQGGPLYLLDVAKVPEEALRPGAIGEYAFLAARECSLGVDVLPTSVAEVDFLAETNLTVAGPGQVQFPEQVCAQQPRVEVSFQATIAVPEGAAPGVWKVHATLHPGPDGLVPRYSRDAEAEVLVSIQAPPKVDPVVLGGDAKESPGLAPVLVTGLLALAAAARRGVR